jgi:hypothetical protein
MPSRSYPRKAALFALLAAASALATAATVPPVPPAAPAPFAIQSEADFFDRLDLERPDLTAVKQAVAVRDWSAAKAAWAQHFETRAAPRWVWSHRDREAIRRVYAENFDGLARYTNAANKVLARDFEFLGVRKQLAHQPEWLQGPVEWTHVLSRFAYWRDLGLAWWGTGDPAYAKDFAFLLEHWIATNPVPARVSNARGARGSVWRTLETGIRADAWFEAMELFMDAPAFDAEAKFLMTRSLVEHARYLAAWTTTFRAGNWQVCEASGLATLGIMLPEFKEAAGWRATGLQYLVEHMQKDVGADGAHWELTPGYHSWVLHEFLKVALLCRANGIAAPGLMDRHEKMFEFLLALARPDATVPAIGDAGFGRQSKVAEDLGLGALFYGRGDMRFLGPDRGVEAWVWLFGPDAGRQYAQLKPHPPGFNSVMLPEAKYAVLRTGWGRDDKFLLFDCAPWRGGHSHQDRLQVAVYAGRDLLVDPGIISYDEPLSHALRKSAAHNVLLIDGQEQPQADPQVLAWHSDTNADFVAGQLTAGGLRQQRSVLFVKPDYWVVADHVAGQGPHQLTRLFHFPLGSAVRADTHCAQTGFNSGTNLRVQAADDAAVELGEGLIPTGAATTAMAPVAALVSKTVLPAALGTVLLPFADARKLPVVRALPGDDPQVLRLEVTFPNGQRDELAIAAAPTDLKIGGQEIRARAACVRRGPMGEGTITVP